MLMLSFKGDLLKLFCQFHVFVAAKTAACIKYFTYFYIPAISIMW